MEFKEVRTKIVATIGPSSNNYETMKNLFEAGVTTVRLNFSHGDIIAHEKNFDLAKKVAKDLNIPLSLMLDTKGPEIRIGKMENDICKIESNTKLKIRCNEKEFSEKIGNNKVIYVSYRMDKDVKKGTKILLDDGKLVTEVLNVKNEEIEVITKNTHMLKTNKRVNIPGVDFSLPFMSEKDKNDIAWGVKYGVNIIAASFVNSAKNVEEIRNIIKNTDPNSLTKICSKIESKKAIENIDEIIKASDAIMIARGDLGLEIDYFDVPYYQKIIIRKCSLAGKPVIVATQMLDSMEKSPLPTRAEVTDVYYAVELGADATMLSGESASGLYPVEAVKIMSRIAKRAETEYYTELFYNTQLKALSQDASPRMKIAYEIAKKLKDGKYKFAVVLSHSGELLKEVSSYRPNAFVIGIVSDNKYVNQYGITNGIFCEVDSENERNLIKNDHEKAKSVITKYNAKKGDNFIVVDGLNITEHTY